MGSDETEEPASTQSSWGSTTDSSASDTGSSTTADTGYSAGAAFGSSVQEAVSSSQDNSGGGLTDMHYNDQTPDPSTIPAWANTLHIYEPTPDPPQQPTPEVPIIPPLGERLAELMPKMEQFPGSKFTANAPTGTEPIPDHISGWDP